MHAHYFFIKFYGEDYIQHPVRGACRYKITRKYYAVFNAWCVEVEYGEWEGNRNNLKNKECENKYQNTLSSKRISFSFYEFFR